MEFVTKSTLTLLLLGCLIQVNVQAYSSGAPPSDEICTSMRPNHPGTPQESPFPYGVKVDSKRVKAGESVNIRISATAEQPFRGFLVQGRKNERDATPRGTFVASDSSQTINCGGADNSAITHANGDEKTAVSLQWQAPKEPGTYLIYVTAVHSGKVYWVKYPAATITVE